MKQSNTGVTPSFDGKLVSQETGQLAILTANSKHSVNFLETQVILVVSHILVIMSTQSDNADGHLMMSTINDTPQSLFPTNSL